jgi:hypothetical protein
MTDRPRKFDGENRQTEELAPENQNAEQDDAAEQTQTFANEALGRSADDFGLEDSKKLPTGDDSDDVEDLVDHMRQMVSSGRIDNSAYTGEPNLDDNEDKYGPGAKEDDLRSDGT